jgi:hypothetical protein
MARTSWPATTLEAAMARSFCSTLSTVEPGSWWRRRRILRHKISEMILNQNSKIIILFKEPSIVYQSRCIPVYYYSEVHLNTDFESSRLLCAARYLNIFPRMFDLMDVQTGGRIANYKKNDAWKPKAK